jgi:DNA modification methylase
MAIHGENLATLAALKAGSGTSGQPIKVDVIYIDPPYNVGGNQGYRNVWKGKSEKERDWAGDHGAFLDFMEPRIKMGRSLLTEEGIMLVSICDGEYCRLKILMDQIFGQENCLGTVIWNKGQGSESKHLRVVHEYVLVYARNVTKALPLRQEKTGANVILDKARSLKSEGLSYQEAQSAFKKWLTEARKSQLIGPGEAKYKLLHPETFRPCRNDDNACAQDKPETRCHKPLIHPLTKKPCKVPSKGWKWSEQRLIQMSEYKKVFKGDGFIIAGQMCYGTDETIVPVKIQYLDEKLTQVLPTVLNVTFGGNKDLPDGIKFSTPKPVTLLKELLKAYPDDQCTVLDYFAGSGTTAQAVFELNQEDGGCRSWIVIEELASTFNNVLVPRISAFDSNKDFSIYETDTADVSNKQLVKTFQKYSFDYLSAYHTFQESSPISKEGMSVLGLDGKTKKIVAMTVPHLRKARHFFEEELALLRDAIKKSSATSALIYTVGTGESYEEPWLGVDKSLLTGTSCKQLQIVEVPEKLVKEWQDVLAGMEAA